MKKWSLWILAVLLFQPPSAHSLGWSNPRLPEVLIRTEFICRGKVLAIYRGKEDSVEISRGWFGDRHVSAKNWPVIQMSMDFAVERILKGKLATPKIRINYWQDNREAAIGTARLLSFAEGEVCYIFLKHLEGENAFRPATPFATSKQSLSGKAGSSFVFEGQGPWPGRHKVELSIFGEKVIIPENTIQAFKAEYTKALQEENSTGTNSEMIRATSVTVIGFSRDRSYLPFFTGTLENDSSPLVRRQAAYALSAQRGPAETIYALIGALRKDPDPGCRRTAAKVLRHFEGPTAATALAKALRKDADPSVRSEALKVLKNMIHLTEYADVKTYASYIRDAMLNDPAERIRIEASQALKELGYE